MKKNAVFLIYTAAKTYLMTITWMGVIVVIGALIPGWTAFIISSGSMSPALDIGNVIISQPLKERAEMGTILTFNDNGRKVTHRVIGMTENSEYVTKGDANPTPDSSTIAQSEVIGKGKYAVPGIGIPTVLLEQKRCLELGGLLLLTAAAAMLVTNFTPEKDKNFDYKNALRRILHRKERREEIAVAI